MASPSAALVTLQTAQTVYATKGAALEAELEALRNVRDTAIREAHRAGMSIRQIASVVGLHPSRIGQILQGY